MANTNDSTFQHYYYIVQRCWFDGPNVFPPVDYMRLLPTPTIAWEVAHWSAHAYAAATANVKQRQLSSFPVRTLLLPTLSGNDNNNNDGSQNQYGFCVAGALFWVRRVQVHLSVSEEAGIPGTGKDLNMHSSSTSMSVEGCSGGSHAVMTNSVIGGSSSGGGRMGLGGRRGTEILYGRIFYGPAAAWHAWETAQKLQQEFQTTAASNNNQESPFSVTWIPMGKPSPNGGDGSPMSSLPEWQRDWPDVATWGQRKNTGNHSQQVTGDGVTVSTTDSIFSGGTNEIGKKRGFNHRQPNCNPMLVEQQAFDNNGAGLAEAPTVDWPFSSPSQHQQQQQQRQFPSTMMMLRAKRPCVEDVRESHQSGEVVAMDAIVTNNTIATTSSYTNHHQPPRQQS